MARQMTGSAAGSAPDSGAAAAAAAGAAGTAAGAERRLVQRMHAGDSVATALVDLAPGTLVRVEGAGPQEDAIEVTVRAPIPFGHKVALRAIPEGEPVLKYGEAIGLASVPIAPGDHVHTHNVDSQRGRGDLRR